MAASPPPPPPLQAAEKKHGWWLSNRKIVDKYLREARALIATREHSKVSSAVGLLDAALAVSPRLEPALELKARSLLFLRRFRDVADMFQDYIPSYRTGSPGSGDEYSSSSSGSSGDHSSAALSRERAKLLSPGRERSSANDGDRSFRCFSVADLKRKVLAGLSRNSGREGHWRYLVLGEACSHLGLMEDAMVLLQTGRRLASAAFRRESVCWSDDSFASCANSYATAVAGAPPSEWDSASQLLSHIKLLLRRRAAAVAALDAGLSAEAVRHFSKVLDGRRSIPSGFAAGCLIGRAAAYRALCRLAEAIADCNRALAIDTSIPALRARADLLEAVGALPDCLRDLDHLKLLYDAIIRDRKLPGPPWRWHNDVRYRDIPASLRALTARIQQLRRRVQAGEGCDVDYYALIGVQRGCRRSELERAQLLLTLKHKPEKATAFIDRLEFADDYRDMDAVRDQAKISASILYRMLQKGYARSVSAIMEEEVAQKQMAKEAAAVSAAIQATAAVNTPPVQIAEKPKAERNSCEAECCSEAEKVAVAAAAAAAAASVFQGVFCRDMAVVGSMLAHRDIPVKYEALSC